MIRLKYILKRRFKKYRTILFVLTGVFVVTIAAIAGMSRLPQREENGSFFSLYKPQRVIHFDIVEKVEEGIALLKSSPPLVFETVSGGPDGRVTRKQIALAILDMSTGEVFEQRVWASEREIEESYKTGIVTLTPDDPDTYIPVRVIWWNSFNTPYEVNGNNNLVVVANKYLIARQYLPEQAYLSLIDNGPQDKYTSMVYAPYSQDLHWPEVVQEGKDYLNMNIEAAFQSLRELEVESRAEPGRLLADVVSRDTIRNIVLIEHVDPNLLSFADDGGKQLAERVLVILGANKEWAYRYTGSGAGATGMAQFIKPTYDMMVTQYPDANMITDYQLGMTDHTNAVKAMALFLDSHKDFLQRRISLAVTEEMLSAVYNGGPSRVIRSVNALGTEWHQSSIFPGETSNYVVKYEIIKALALFN